MALARSRLRARRAEFMHSHGSINLVPLVDILTAIVFFSLLSVVTLRSALASFDLAQPPTASVGNSSSMPATSPAADVVVRVDRDRFVVRHSGGQTMIPREDAQAALTTLHGTLVDLTRVLDGRAHITVVPSDDVLYDDLVRVLDEVHQVDPRAVSLGARARQ